jgi:hypothetical protein
MRPIVITARTLTRTLLVALLVGAMSVSMAWAGASLAPVDRATDTVEDLAQEPERLTADQASTEDEDAAPSLLEQRRAEQQAAVAEALAAAQDLGEGTIMAGAAKVDMEPRPDLYDGVWETEGCATMGGDAGEETLTHVPDFDQSLWPAKTGCIYMGGYGIGPMNPVTTWDDEHGLHVRSVALSDGNETVVLTLIDAVYYLGRYNEMCDDCGSLDIAERLGDELGIDPAGVFISATHSHTAPDLIGGWGGVPDWYMQQVNDAIEGSIKDALANMEPAVLEVGEVFARQYNSERRNVYRSAEEPGMSWLRALAVNDEDGDTHAGDGNRSPNAPPRDDDTEPRVIATVGAYAAHPVTRSAGSGVAHGDWPAVFAKHLEDNGSGVGMALATGLGNVSPRRLGDHGGAHLAADIPPPGSGTFVTDPRVSVAAERWQHPVTNPILTALAAPGFFDRPFEAGPASVSVGTHDARPCVSTSPVAVETQVNAARIGDLLITGAPGETFSNLSNTIKSQNPTGVTMPLGMVNDGLGYIIQSFEADDGARQGPGFVATDAGFEYEDAYAIDGCFGDMVLENTLGLLGQLGD